MSLDGLAWIDVTLSAIIAAVVGGIILFFILRPWRDKPAQPLQSSRAGDIEVAGSPHAQVAVGNNISQQFGTTILVNGQKAEPDYRPTPSPAEIKAAPYGRPDFEHPQIFKTYENLAVEWDVIFHSLGHGHASELYLATLYYSEESLNTILCEGVDLDAFPRLKLAVTGDKLRVRGVIANVTRTTVTLKDVTFIFPR
jgi:hypothetical protein